MHKISLIAAALISIAVYAAPAAANMCRDPNAPANRGGGITCFHAQQMNLMGRDYDEIATDYALASGAAFRAAGGQTPQVTALLLESDVYACAAMLAHRYLQVSGGHVTHARRLVTSGGAHDSGLHRCKF